MMYRALRWIVSLLYLVAVLLAFLLTLGPPGVASGPSFPPTLLSLTVSYGILMVLILLHERFRPPQ
jgi:hypothetical protein